DGRFCVSDSTATIAGLVSSSCDEALDCNATTCVDGDGPQWGTVAAKPRYLKNDLDGFGPDAVAVDPLPPGDYLIAIEEPADKSVTATNAEVQIALHGSVASTFFIDLALGAYAEVALVHVDDAGAVCLEDLTDGDAADDCP
ncbi:MAG TPA: hypothetical protein VGO62_02725, partial [Myxococcota bacterium]